MRQQGSPNVKDKTASKEKKSRIFRGPVDIRENLSIGK